MILPHFAASRLKFGAESVGGRCDGALRCSMASLYGFGRKRNHGREWFGLLGNCPSDALLEVLDAIGRAIALAMHLRLDTLDDQVARPTCAEPRLHAHRSSAPCG